MDREIPLSKQQADELWLQAEQSLGAEIAPLEWHKARASAQRKLDDLIKRFGDDGGTMREPWYLAQLIAEAVRSDRLSRYCHRLMELREEQGTKKDSPCPKTQGRPSFQPYCITAAPKMQ